MAFRALRLLRMVKLSRQWNSLKQMMGKITQSTEDISSFSLLLLIFVYIFALLGIELFSCSALNDIDGNLVLGKENVQALYISGEPYLMPRDNFNNIGYAVITIFIVIMGEGWSSTMYQWVRALSYYKTGGEIEDSTYYWLALSYFLILMIVGNFILLSLFTAILLQNFDTGSE